MGKMNFEKYQRYPRIKMPERSWPEREIIKAPRWVSVDLRDGNQALPVPMNIEEKLELFKLLVEIGFKEIEVAFPAAAQVEFDFVRKLIEENHIPEDVTIQVLTQAREHLVRRTFEALQGVKRATVHVYNSTSTTQRRVVFGKDKAEITKIATDAAALMNELRKKLTGSHIQFEYTPESFTGTELDYALEICEAVMAVWQPTLADKMIINLPSTIEMSTPNIFADRIEWFNRHLKKRDCVILSVHPHNDRGTAVAAGELTVMAGAERVEGALFGNGERTGNMDILIMAMNLFAQDVGRELTSKELHDCFREAYLRGIGRYSLKKYSECTKEGVVNETMIEAVVGDGKLEIEIKSKGNGPIDAFVTGLRRYLIITVEVLMYEEHALTSGAAAEAIAYIGLSHEGKTVFGAGIDSNIGTASVKAVLSAVNRMVGGYK
ncbi:hypothetical protein A2291_01495 [candidate division WOR-1 bacterium RIFOXYB2_FULL_42_35]|uniref:Pyruvate carboxyltransferase domain-containing protein n=1 Tax=candidate division WOR-1 bacterium RIFOXYC2_FULL_41_25 TaxID=1802586 RepID=A0A1F4TKR7_UNCSA|nr:MAG: hypothetical protein A2247_06185 [candidate division WOR-1 bacterium RIFOXYA2_FULL_41_14]OGC22131.1 MAG: hypothetical protein A2291_01495 [candidate division WOR-1 bacterium RIFOXYB2_FULL_42_35]OGC33318.1 MAG: hypothetical protein A2462_00015 [candidate division WOR-1 bacterium RIFOXYC2_FULL_41_25]